MNLVLTIYICLALLIISDIVVISLLVARVALIVQLILFKWGIQLRKLEQPIKEYSKSVDFLLNSLTVPNISCKWCCILYDLSIGRVIVNKYLVDQ